MFNINDLAILESYLIDKHYTKPCYKLSICENLFQLKQNTHHTLVSLLCGSLAATKKKKSRKTLVISWFLVVVKGSKA